jgi:hypothetical protein
MPQNYVAALHLISMSLQNVLTTAKAGNGANRSELQLVYPTDESEFDAPWRLHPRISNFSMNSVIDPGEINPLGKTETLALYDAPRKRVPDQTT